MKTRCRWVSDDPLYIAYHDNEWGKPVTDDRQLFEQLLLEGAQAGLSWITILKKREQYRRIFHQFDPVKIANMSDLELEQCLLDPGIVRNRLKVYGFRKNAQAYLVIKQGQPFSDFVWQFVNHQTRVNNWSAKNPLPSSTKESDAMSKALKKAGFTFVGSTICYAFMQAVGMVDDHALDCFCRQ